MYGMNSSTRKGQWMVAIMFFNMNTHTSNAPPPITAPHYCLPPSLHCNICKKGISG